jgi:beta-lysine 5,6-aminomutase beta subunit
MTTNTYPKAPNLHNLRPYGDTLDDGKVQLSFTLPVPAGPEAYEAAKRLALQMGLQDPSVVSMEAVGATMSFFIVYAACVRGVDFTTIHVPRSDYEAMDMEAIDALIDRELGRPITVIGACTGTDAHTVGIDAIMNMKGYNGHYGLERYRMVNAVNMGAQVPNEVLVARAIAEDADAILVSQVVTQKNLHVMTLTNLVEILEAEGVRRRFVVAVGGPRITHDLATELGFDAGFGVGCYAEDVAAFVVQELIRRRSVGA